jgi:hypothetical protein|tara:strand:+ start:3671 stop:4126 length:456 start_codon:yes stop_codon:yes gene_type:complete
MKYLSEDNIKTKEIISQMRKEGKTFRVIGLALGFKRQRAHSIFHSEVFKKQCFCKKQIIYTGKYCKDCKPTKKGIDRTRGLVRIRDNFTCQMCGKKHIKGERAFDVHHLKGECGKKSRTYDRISEIDNLITLCHPCHYKHPDFSQSKKAPH